MSDIFYTAAHHLISYNGASSTEDNILLCSQIVTAKALSDTHSANAAALSEILKDHTASAISFDKIIECANARPEALSEDLNSLFKSWNDILLPKWAIFQPVSANIATKFLVSLIESMKSVTLRIDASTEENSSAVFMEAWIKFLSENCKNVCPSTPLDVAELKAKLLAPQSGDTVYDPCAGFASLLINTTRGNDSLRLYGQELNNCSYTLALMNCMLHGNMTARISCGDSIADPILAEDGSLMRFDKCLTEPPMGMRMPVETLEKDAHNRFNWGLTARSRSEWLFLFDMLAHCREKQGKLVIMVPLGMLYATGNESNLRAQLVEKNLIDAVIALPPKMLYNTNIATALLVIDKRREPGAELENRKDILFINAANLSETKRGRAELSAASIERIVSCYTNRTVEQEFSYVATVAEVAEKGNDLSPDVYTCPPPAVEQVDAQALAQEINELEALIKIKQQKLDELLKKLRK